MNRATHLVIGVFAVLATGAFTVRADAIFVTRAMKATTIVEIFVMEERVRVEVEIGLPDLEAFRNVVPDAIYEQMGYPPRPYAERFPDFFQKDFVIRDSSRRPLPGHVTAIEVRPRTLRDDVTGEPLPSDEAEIETVLAMQMIYEFAQRPDFISIQPPAASPTDRVNANIGFVVYHMGLPTTDFRYLGAEETLDLDWEDPWYSKFRNRNLKRRFDAPISAFLYVEPFEVRKEIIVRPRDLQKWVDLGLAGKDTIRVGEQEEIKRRVAEFLAERSPVDIDGRRPVPELDRIHFVRRSLRRTGVIDPPEDLPIVSATLGVIYVYPVDSLPTRVEMSWSLFDDRIRVVPSVATDEAGGLPYSLTPDDSILVWQNFLTNPTVPALVDVQTPRASRVPLPVLSAVSIVLFSVAGARFLRRRSRAVMGWSAAILAVLAAVMWPFARVGVPVGTRARVSEESAAKVVGALLTNVYRAFDFREENAIYDTLARSASGDLLTKVYLETRRSLELQSQGGARVKVKNVSIMRVEHEELANRSSFTATCTWNVTGTIGHWGHIHKRTNQYDAVITIEPVDGVWKITVLELIEEKRLS